MYNVLQNSIKPNLLQRAAIALSRADQLTAAREYRLHGRVLYSQGGLDAARRYLGTGHGILKVWVRSGRVQARARHAQMVSQASSRSS